MELPNADILELKDKMTELINIMKGFAVDQKALADKVEKLERASAVNSVVNLDGVSNQGLGGSRDGENRETVGMVNNNAAGFGVATGGGPGQGQNPRDGLLSPFFGFDEDREEDREADQFSMHNEPFGQYNTQPQNKEIQLLAEKVRALESHATPGFVNMSNMGLVEGIVIPQKFKAPAFDKYNGSSCPETHLQAFVRKISAYTTDQKLWMYFFQDSLSGGSLEWYTKLKSSDIKSWQDLGDAFFKQYQFNADMAPSRTQLQGMSQKNNEGFKEYAQRWRELAARVQPPLVDREMSDLFMGTLQGVFAERMVGCPVTNFADIVVAGERIESWLKMGKIQGGIASSSGSKKPFGNGQRKNEGESSAVYAQGGRGRDRYYQHVAAVTIPAGNHSARQQRQPPQQRAGYQAKGKGVDRHCDKPPVSYAVLFKKLRDLGLVQPRAMVPIRTDQWPPDYDENAKCEFHSGTQGHNIEGCRAFKNVVQDLVDSKAINFAPSPNVNANPMPVHGQATVSAIAEDADYTCAVGGETNSDCKLDGWVKPCAPGQQILNWRV
ncbi:uncharacterized protein LOC127105390 [Lathyrus oleraceus]|uniref:uncharacterized protein LOC127105390 n=1 Tax=Pisum sativum TaxID=3888 RepID=UPI0021D33CBE|nr:uncharacterized protein LOC127105390 [Pisum sativum]